MPGWGEILVEIQENGFNADLVRDQYLARVHEITGRSVVSYATDFLGKGGLQSMITLTDMQGMMEVFRGLPGPNLDLILHSPGGQAEATDRIVRYIRSKFDHVRVFVPLAAMSAATMLSMAADEIVMGKHSQLGPIDPQVTIPNGMQMPAGALLEQFAEAVEQCAKDPSKITGWLPTLQQYPPGLLNVCNSAADLSKQLVEDYLTTYMFRGRRNKAARAAAVAEWLANDKVHLSHSRPITREELRAHGVRVTDLEAKPDLQDAVLSVHHATMHSFGGSAVKIIENQLGRRFVQHQGQQVVVPSQP